MGKGSAPEIAVIIPCFNEEGTIEDVVQLCRKYMPGCKVYVYDNNSTDRTAEVAARASAIVRRESRQGKGNVVRRMFADIEADIYVMMDGDLTYEVNQAPKMIDVLLTENLDMVVGARLKSSEKDTFPYGHYLGNILLTKFIGVLFGKQFTDVLSGYRVFSRRFVKSFPVSTVGFEIETELTVHALELRMPVQEIEAYYKARSTGSASKLKTYRDGLRILWTIVVLYKEVRPLAFFSMWFVLFLSVAGILAYPVFIAYFETGLVPRFPTWIAAVGSMIIAFLSLTCGFILDSVSRGRLEMKRLRYLSIPMTGK
jgi:glycosyltransferase involved in cell wall biosynthesis